MLDWVYAKLSPEAVSVLITQQGLTITNLWASPPTYGTGRTDFYLVLQIRSHHSDMLHYMYICIIYSSSDSLPL